MTRAELERIFRKGAADCDFYTLADGRHGLAFLFHRPPQDKWERYVRRKTWDEGKKESPVYTHPLSKAYRQDLGLFLAARKPGPGPWIRGPSETWAIFCSNAAHDFDHFVGGIVDDLAKTGIICDDAKVDAAHVGRMKWPRRSGGPEQAWLVIEERDSATAWPGTLWADN